MIDYEDILAKNMFFEYCGSFEQMSRDGVYDQYLSYGAPKEYEPYWAMELGEKLLKELTMEEIEPLFRLEMLSRGYYSENLLKGILEYAANNIEYGDSFIKLRYVETIIIIMGTAGKEKLDETLLKSGISICRELLKKTEEKPDLIYNKWQLRLEEGQSMKSLLGERVEEAYRKLSTWF